MIAPNSFNPFEDDVLDISISRITSRRIPQGDLFDEILQEQTSPHLIQPIPVEDWFEDYREEFPDMSLEEIGERYADYLANVEHLNTISTAEFYSESGRRSGPPTRNIRPTRTLIFPIEDI